MADLQRFFTVFFGRSKSCESSLLKVRKTRKLRFESLEDRSLLAVDALGSGELVVGLQTEQGVASISQASSEQNDSKQNENAADVISVDGVSSSTSPSGYEVRTSGVSDSEFLDSVDELDMEDVFDVVGSYAASSSSDSSEETSPDGTGDVSTDGSEANWEGSRSTNTIDPSTWLIDNVPHKLWKPDETTESLSDRSQDHSSDDLNDVGYGRNDASGNRDGGSGGSGGGDVSDWDLMLTATLNSSVVELATANGSDQVAYVNPLFEGKAPGTNPSFYSPESYDYYCVTAPALPLGYSAQIRFEGVATPGSDFCVYLSPSFTQYNNGIEYSGGSTTFYIFPLNDSIMESMETFKIKLGTPFKPESGGENIPDYHFNNVNVELNATIIDDDQWKISAETTDGQILEPCAGSLTELQTSGSICVSCEPNLLGAQLLSRSTGYQLDRSYPINVNLALSGTADVAATSRDYVFKEDLDDALELPFHIEGNARYVTVAIPEDSRAVTAYVTALRDVDYEQNETIQITPTQSWSTLLTAPFDTVGESCSELTIFQAPEFVSPTEGSSVLFTDADHFTTIAYEQDTGKEITDLTSLSETGWRKYQLVSAVKRGTTEDVSNWVNIDPDLGKITATQNYNLESDVVLTVRIYDPSIRENGGECEQFCDLVTIDVGTFNFARVYDQNQTANRSTRAVSSNSREWEDNKRSDYESYTIHIGDATETREKAGIVIGGWDENMSVAYINVEIDASTFLYDGILWNASINPERSCSLKVNHQTTVDSFSGIFPNGNDATVRVIPQSPIPPIRGANSESEYDVKIQVGYDFNNNGVLDDNEVCVDFLNIVYGKIEYDAALLFLSNVQGFSSSVTPLSSELLGYFLKTVDPEDNCVISDDTLCYQANVQTGYSQSNGMGIDIPEIQHGDVDKYIYDSDSDFAMAIIADSYYQTRLIDSLHKMVNNNISSARTYFIENPTATSWNTSATDCTAGRFNKNENQDLYYALRSCTLTFNCDLTFYKMDNNKISYSVSNFVGHCIDLYDFETSFLTAWISFNVSDSIDLDEIFGDVLIATGSILQSCHRMGVRNTGEIFEIDVQLDLSSLVP